jgi:minichromosome maintenance protein 10
VKSNPNASPAPPLLKKRKLEEMATGAGPSGKKGDLEIDTSSAEFKSILEAKSSHANFLEDLVEDEYFSTRERKEAIENKLLSTFSIPTTAVMCRACKYVALSQSDFCKKERHPIRVVKANKRFFKCKDCGNRTMSLDRLPKRRESNISMQS